MSNIDRSETAAPAVGAPLERGVMQHAPGPWRAEYPCIYSRDGAKLIEVDEYMCCTVYDADLMASAPELLQCLRAVEVLFAPSCKDATQADWLDKAQALLRRLGAA